MDTSETEAGGVIGVVPYLKQPPTNHVLGNPSNGPLDFVQMLTLPENKKENNNTNDMESGKTAPLDVFLQMCKGTQSISRSTRGLTLGKNVLPNVGGVPRPQKSQKIVQGSSAVAEGHEAKDTNDFVHFDDFLRPPSGFILPKDANSTFRPTIEMGLSPDALNLCAYMFALELDPQ